MPIPQPTLDNLRQTRPDIILRYLKIQKTDDANIVPDLDFKTYSAFPSRQYFDRNDFGRMVFSSRPDEKSLRLHLLVPYYPVHEGDAKVDWMEKKTAVARKAI